MIDDLGRNWSYVHTKMPHQVIFQFFDELLIDIVVPNTVQMYVRKAHYVPALVVFFVPRRGIHTFPVKKYLNVCLEPVSTVICTSAVDARDQTD